MTNGDRIRNMTNSELCEFITAVRCCFSYRDVSCGFPFCQYMNGGGCRGMSENPIDKVTLNWLEKEVCGQLILILLCQEVYYE